MMIIPEWVVTYHNVKCNASPTSFNHQCLAFNKVQKMSSFVNQAIVAFDTRGTQGKRTAGVST